MLFPHLHHCQAVGEMGVLCQRILFYGFSCQQEIALFIPAQEIV